MICPRKRKQPSGMTFVELVLCLFVLSVLTTAAFPLVENSQLREKELILAEHLRCIRQSIDRFYSKKERKNPKSLESERYPRSLQELLDTRCLRSLPEDPITGRADWIIVSTSDENPLSKNFESNEANIFDVRSRSLELSRRGKIYRSW